MKLNAAREGRDKQREKAKQAAAAREEAKAAAAAARASRSLSAAEMKKLDEEAAATLLSTLALSSLEELEKVLGPGSQALAELRSLFGLAEAYGLSEWLVLDLSVVRGLAYYTGVVF